MTESEWLATTDPAVLRKVRKKKVTDRKLQLFPVASARLVWETLTRTGLRDAVEKQENLADKFVGKRATSSWLSLTDWSFNRNPDYEGENILAVISPFATLTEEFRTHQERRRIRTCLAFLMHDIFGNPVTLSPCWLNATVTSLAQAIYNERQLRPLRQPSSPTPSKKPGATAPTSSTTAASQGSTCGAVRWST